MPEAAQLTPAKVQTAQALWGLARAQNVLVLAFSSLPSLEPGSANVIAASHVFIM
jgi:hypothetical protein